MTRSSFRFGYNGKCSKALKANACSTVISLKNRAFQAISIGGGGKYA